MFFESLEENTVYEVLVSTSYEGVFNIKPFGVRVDGDKFILRLYSNMTLFNIRGSGTFMIHFTGDVSLYVDAVFGLLDEDSLDLMDVSVLCEVCGHTSSCVEDAYGKNVTTTIISKPVKIIKNKETISIINRSTNKIIELLVDYTRYNYMDIHAKKEYIKKLELTEKFIQKNGNKKHKKAIKTIKKEVNLHD